MKRRISVRSEWILHSWSFTLGSIYLFVAKFYEATTARLMYIRGFLPGV